MTDRTKKTALFACLVAFAQITTAQSQTVGPWATYRGNAQRTGSTDGLPGPAGPKVLWALKSKDHYIAAPVPAGSNENSNE